MSKLKTPKEKEESRKKRAEELEKALKFCKTNFNAVAATEEGLDVFRFLMDFCNYQKPNITINPNTGEINKGTSDFLEARRGVYLEMRKYISAKFLKKIEFK